MTNYPLVKQAGIIRYPPVFFFPIAGTQSISALKKRKTEVISTFSVLPITILCLPFSVRRSTPVTSARLAVSRFRPPLLRYVRSVFAALSPDTRKIRVSGNKNRSRLCGALRFRRLPNNARIGNRPVFAVKAVKRSEVCRSVNARLTFYCRYKRRDACKFAVHAVCGIENGRFPIRLNIDRCGGSAVDRIYVLQNRTRTGYTPYDQAVPREARKAVTRFFYNADRVCDLTAAAQRAYKRSVMISCVE